MVKEVRLLIAGTEYREGDIVTLSTHRQLFEGAPSIGNCITGELNAELRISSDLIPRNAEIKPYVKESDDTDWKPKSVFYVYQRKIDRLTDTVRITAYDASFRTDQPFIGSNDDINFDDWPRTAYSVMTDIAQRCQITICSDTLTRIQNDVRYVRFPGSKVESDIDTHEEKFVSDGDAALTMREVACDVAKMYAANWAIDNKGEWRLIGFGDVPLDSDYLVTENREIIVLGNGLDEFGNSREVRLLVR